MEVSLFWIFFCLARAVLCFESYQSNIPNGNNVPHPCKPGSMWPGVGHKLAVGGKNRNYFGKDFESTGKMWTQTLCRKDSDGDGKTNGEELGDPNCIWSQGQLPEISKNITHPGVCEPWNHPRCQQQWKWLESECNKKEFVCDAISETGVQNMTVQFPESKIPPRETTYICVIFDLPQDNDYHLIATKPLIDNTNIVHHAVLFGCEDDVELEPIPTVCDMVPNPRCREILSTWTVGFSGDCVHNHTGFRIGINGYKRAALQFHWNNPALHSTYTDNSGLILYFTDDLRTHDAGILTVGANYLNIPPGVERTTYVSYCPAQCTDMFINDKVYIASANNHMHYLGVSQRIEQYRNGSRLQDITSETMYNYDNPKTFRYDKPIELFPGDTIKTTYVELEPIQTVCDMVPNPRCREMLSTWTVGFNGDCVHNHTGFRIGINGYKRAALQFHWNNPALHSTYTDNSGLILYFTDDLRTHDAGILTVGANYLNIPPGVERTTYVSYCPAQCTDMFINDKVYIASANNHMHYLGVSQRIEQYRNGSRLQDITSETMYNYDNPKTFRYDKPIELFPGDTIKTTCTYNSLSKNTTTYFGDSTTDEMCFGFITYFPKQNLNISLCTSWKSIPMCVIRSGQSYNGCYLQEFLKFSEARFMWLFNAVMEFCDKQCSTQCLEVVEEIETLPCLIGEFREYVKHFMEGSPQFREFFKIFENCLKIVESNNLSTGVYQNNDVSVLYILLIFFHAVLCFICN
ncbi:hypothetical protein LOTGIDRAFT_158680 [Lottia gigantea]|uniref:DOMON domain-containing protein n=1 Tax=Lottia gigantea TaxID=225164 RepID=V4ANJ1_LOTGI|nr:hypothetical protein LOTGIDRAFT_158680 [Lottia gigantea]ESO98732.1 hypothetical protein LOTGIDRAFT_158680 [Lottia gigantea]